MTGATLHVLYSPRAEGCPRLALGLIRHEFREFGQRGSVAFLVDTPSDLIEEFRDSCQHVAQLGWTRRGFLGLAWRMLVLLRRHRPRLVVCYSLGHHLSVSLAAWLLGIANVVHIGTRPPPRHEATFAKLRFALRLGQLWVTRYIACSSAVAEACRIAYGVSAEVIENGIELEKFVCVRRLRNQRVFSGERDELQIGTVASLETSKDHEILIRSVAELDHRGNRVRLHLVGDGSHRPYLMQMVEDLRIAGQVTWHGSLRDVTPVLAMLDVFAFPATDQEGLGIALIEALAAGVPVVASDVAATREVLDNGRYGMIVGQRTAEAWADALLTVHTADPPAVEAVSRYDIAHTWRLYRRLGMHSGGKEN